MNLEQLERLATAPMSPPPPRREPRPPRERERIRESFGLLAEELAFSAYDMLLNGTALGRRADHDTSMEFASLVADILRKGFDEYQTKGEELND